MADEISEELGKSWNVCKFKGICPEQMLKKGKKAGQECCAAENCNNRSDHRPDLSFHEFPSDRQGRKTWEIRMKLGDTMESEMVQNSTSIFSITFNKYDQIQGLYSSKSTSVSLFNLRNLINFKEK